MNMDPAVARNLEEFRKTVATEGEHIVFKVFPRRILELQKLILSTSKEESPYHLSHASKTTDATVYPSPASSIDESQTKKRKREDESSTNDHPHARFPDLVKANQHIACLHASVKAECQQFVEEVDKVKLWVNLTMPKIEDGDNFGVQIQEEVLAELHRAHESAYNVRDAPRQDYIGRAKLCSKILKYPHIEDYALALKEHDERQLYLIRQHLFDIRDMYAVLTDVIHKNISKIRAPKANNSVGLY